MGTQELLLVVLVGLLLFGASRLPELARAVGTSIREFKKAAAGGDASSSPPPSASQPPQSPDGSASPPGGGDPS